MTSALCDLMLWMTFSGALSWMRRGHKVGNRDELWRQLWALHRQLGCPAIGCMDLW